MIIERMLHRSLTFSPNGNLVSDDKGVATFSGLVCNCIRVNIVLCMDMYYKKQAKSIKCFFKLSNLNCQYYGLAVA